MKKSTYLVLAISLMITACNGVWGVVTSFEVFSPFTLESDYAVNETYPTVSFQPGIQNTDAWKAYAYEKNSQMQVALVRKEDRVQFTIDQEKFAVATDKVGSKDATTPWNEFWQSCTYTEQHTVCGPHGCSTHYVTRPGRELVRARTVGTYDDYQVRVSQGGSAMAQLAVTMDNTKREVQQLTNCR